MRNFYPKEIEVFSSTQRQRDLAIVLCILLSISLFISIITIISLLPLKEVKPYVIMVDKSSGLSQNIADVQPIRIDQDDLIVQSELARYVTSRETYDVNDNNFRINAVLERSIEGASTSLKRLWSSSNEHYPPNNYGEKIIIKVKVHSVTFLEKSTAQVRFTKSRIEDGFEAVTRSFVATLNYNFNPRMERTLERAWRNPFGFVVSAYRVDAETLMEGKVQ